MLGACFGGRTGVHTLAMTTGSLVSAGCGEPTG